MEQPKGFVSKNDSRKVCKLNGLFMDLSSLLQLEYLF